MRTLATAICLSIFVGLMVATLALKAQNIDMTEMRFFVTYWPLWPAMFASGSGAVFCRKGS